MHSNTKPAHTLARSHNKFQDEVRKGHACAIKLGQEKKQDMTHDCILCEGEQRDDVLSTAQYRLEINFITGTTRTSNWLAGEQQFIAAIRYVVTESHLPHACSTFSFKLLHHRSLQDDSNSDAGP